MNLKVFLVFLCFVLGIFLLLLGDEDNHSYYNLKGGLKEDCCNVCGGLGLDFFGIVGKGLEKDNLDNHRENNLNFLNHDKEKNYNNGKQNCKLDFFF